MKRTAKRILKRVTKTLATAYRNTIRKRKMKECRRKIFIDCGANTCDVLRSYIKKYPDFEFFAFEAQPELAREGRRVIDENPNSKVSFYSKAVWIRDEPIDFYLASHWGRNYRGGSTLIHGQTRNSSKVDYARAVTVDAIDFSRWLAKNSTPDDYVIIKMDIEGAEYDVIEKIISDNNHNLVDELIIEFHQDMNDSISKERHDSLVRQVRSFCDLEIWH
jgi:FkbM family methyltransferase